MAAQERDGLVQALLRLDRTIWLIAYSYSRNAEDAADLAQEVRLRVLEKGAGFRGAARPETWIYRIAVNVCRDQVRAGSRKRSRELALETDIETPTEDREALLALRSALDALPPRQRQLLSLREFGGLSYREIAAALGISIGSVESGIFDARSRLARLLATRRGGRG